MIHLLSQSDYKCKQIKKMKSLVNKINEGVLSNKIDLGPEQILALFGALCYVDSSVAYDDLAKVLHIDRDVFDELWEDLSVIVRHDIIGKIKDYKDLTSDGHLDMAISKIVK